MMYLPSLRSTWDDLGRPPVYSRRGNAGVRAAKADVRRPTGIGAPRMLGTTNELLLGSKLELVAGNMVQSQGT
jgi:hypothetical protein